MDRQDSASQPEPVGVPPLSPADRQRNEFLATLAHKLRNPLAPIRNALQLMKMAGTHSVALREARDMAERQLHHLVQLVDDLLDVSHVLSGKMELRKRRIDLAMVVNRGVETARSLMDAHGREFMVVLPSQPIFIEADFFRLAQVISNLLSNAAKYSGKAEPIWLTAELAGEEVEIRVRDAGIGITAELLPCIFDLFVLGGSSPAPSQGGLRIGLTLAKRLVELHGGSIMASSAGPGQGSEFVVRLPILSNIPQREEAGQREGHVLAAGVSRRVLVVDDSVDAAESTARLLTLWGHLAQTAYDGSSAIEAVHRFRPEVVLLDIGLPGMTGYEVARQLRALPEFKSLVLVALTGYDQEDLQQCCQEAGFDHHLTKPAEPDALEAALATVPG